MTCPDCGGPGAPGVVAYYAEDVVCAAYRCKSCDRAWGVLFEARSDYVCSCGEELTVNEFTGPLDGAVADGRLVLRLPCRCGVHVKDDFDHVGVVELRA